MRGWTRGLLMAVSVIGLVAVLESSAAWGMGGGGGRKNRGGGEGYSQSGGSSHGGSSHGGGSHNSVATPEPLTMLAVGSGLAGTAAYRFIRRRKK